jgi:hypothetical protein
MIEWEAEVPADLKKAKAYRERANSLRSIADSTAEKMREALILVAEDYDRMAAAVDARRRGRAPSSN